MEYYWLSRKFQSGGAVQQMDGQVDQLIQMLKSDPQNAPQAIAQLLQSQDGQTLLQQAAQVDPEIGDMVQMVIDQLQGQATQQPQLARKGTKIVEACGGLKAPRFIEKGGKQTKKAERGTKVKKAGCGCKAKLHRVGGKIIEICE